MAVSRIPLKIVLTLFLLFNGSVFAVYALGLAPKTVVLEVLLIEAAAITCAGLFLYAKHLLVFVILLVGAAMVPEVQAFVLRGDMKIPLAFWSLYSLLWLLYFEIRKSRFGQGLRPLHPMMQLLFYMSYLVAAAALAYAMTGLLFYGKVLLLRVSTHTAYSFLTLVVLIPTLTIALLRIVDMVGARHFLHFLLGTYHRPIERSRIVMFLDMVGSSAVAERLGAAQSISLIAQFIFDAGHAFRTHGGDIVNYTGDGLVVLWPVDAADSALRAVETLQRRLNKNRHRYEKAFGIFPGFRIGLHAGPVVLAQIGEEKLFLGVYGDTVNTAARIEALNKALNTQILVSKNVRQRASNAWRARLVPQGMQDISGREQSVEVFSLAL